MVGIFAFWMFSYATRDRFFNSKTFDSVRLITPLPTIINFWIIKVLFVVGGLICVAADVYGITKPFL